MRFAFTFVHVCGPTCCFYVWPRFGPLGVLPLLPMGASRFFTFSVHDFPRFNFKEAREGSQGEGKLGEPKNLNKLGDAKNLNKLGAQSTSSQVFSSFSNARGTFVRV